MPRPYDPLKAARSRLIRALGGRKALPKNAAALIDDAMEWVLICGAVREREHTQKTLEHPTLAQSRVLDTYGIWQRIISKSVTETTGIRQPPAAGAEDA